MRAPWDRRRVAAVAAGGAAGAALRWLALTALAQADGIPWTVLVLNVAGSFALGALLAAEWSHSTARVLLHDAGAIGFCGGLTTFSTFTVELVDLVRAGDSGLAVAYGLLSVLLSLAALVAGAALLRRVRALRLPLEEVP